MSNIKARLLQPTGLEFHDTAFKIDQEIWNFIKHEYKNKSKDEQSNIPSRYWTTHAVPLHNECWKLISKITYANSIYPTRENELEKRKMYQQEAIGHCQNLFQLIRIMLVEIPTIDANKLSNALTLIDTECDLLRAWKRSSKLMTNNNKSNANIGE